MKSGRPIALLLDYDGTLVPFAPTPDDAVPDRELLDLLAALAASPHIDLHLVSGRSLDTMNRWFRHLAAGLWAEHGAACRRAPGAAWEILTPPGFDAGAIDGAEAMLAEVTRATPGALVERKHTSVAWHYRRVEPRLADERLGVVRERAAAFAGEGLELIEGRKVLEIRPRGVSKANAVERIARGLRETTPMVAIGDDRTDEDMFVALRQPAVAIRVGDGPTRAGYRLAAPWAVRLFLPTLLRNSQLTMKNLEFGGGASRARSDPSEAGLHR